MVVWSWSKASSAWVFSGQAEWSTLEKRLFTCCSNYVYKDLAQYGETKINKIAVKKASLGLLKFRVCNVSVSGEVVHWGRGGSIFSVFERQEGAQSIKQNMEVKHFQISKPFIHNSSLLFLKKKKSIIKTPEQWYLLVRAGRSRDSNQCVLSGDWVGVT